VWISGQRVETGQTFEVVDPSTEEVFAEVFEAGPAEIERAAQACQAAQGDWGGRSGKERAGFLRQLGQAIREQQQSLAELEVRDNGKPLPEALWDVADAAGCFDFYAQLAEELDARQGEPITLPDQRFRSQVFHEPIGPAALIIPWNYPLLMAAWKVAPALAAGCTCVLKPSELTPMTALQLGQMAQQVGLPTGVFHVLTGRCGAQLSSHPVFPKVAFTGSVPTGRAVMQAGAAEIKSVSLELGGKSACLVFDDADLEAAVEWILFGIFWNQGQVCSATSRLLVQQGIADRLLERLVEEARRIPMGPGMQEGVKLGPLVSGSQREKVHAYVTRAEGQLLCGGQVPDRKGFYYPPTILLNASGEAWTEEIFGPVLAVSTFSDEAEAVRRANDSRFGLAAAVLSSDSERCRRVARALQAGIVWINCSQPTFSEAPWGGCKHSGIGRELGHWGLANYLEVKQVTEYVSAEPWGWYLG
jgi:betaine-aldehyde dehydrogenase